jgi:hypothetical protein
MMKLIKLISYYYELPDPCGNKWCLINASLALASGQSDAGVSFVSSSESLSQTHPCNGKEQRYDKDFDDRGPDAGAVCHDRHACQCDGFG